MRPSLALLALGLFTAVFARRGRDDGDSDDDDATTSTNSTSTTSSNSTSSGLTAGMVCSKYMCIQGIVNGSTTQYTLMDLGKANLGFMAMGFGGQMANSPMVIMWSNSDGTVTLSQREAPSEVMPTVDSSPPRVATLDDTATNVQGAGNTNFSFTISSASSTSQTIIWAYGTTNPDDSAKDATLTQHPADGSGPLSLDLSAAFNEGGSIANSGGAVSTPLQPFQKMIIAHAILCTIGFLILLPAGALLARYARTFTNAWFGGHWFFQFAFAGPVIVAGFALGVASIQSAGVEDLDDTHKKWGVAIFVLYIVQLLLGAVVHWVKPASWTVHKKRPLQNYLHAVFGLVIIGLAFYQVHTGYDEEWPNTSGRPDLSNAVNIVWIVWVVLIPVLYLVGLAFLPKQFRQEKPPVKEAHYMDEPRYSDRS